MNELKQKDFEQLSEMFEAVAKEQAAGVSEAMQNHVGWL